MSRGAPSSDAARDLAAGGGDGAAPVPRRSRPLALWALDVGIAGASAYTAVTLTLELSGGLTPAGRAVAVTLAAVHGAVLAVRRLWPRQVLAATVVTGLLYSFAGLGVYRLGPAVLIAMYTAAARTPRRNSVLTLGAAAVGLLAALVIGGQFRGLDTPVLYVVLLAVSWFLGDVVQRTRQAAAEHAQRADELERARGELARYAVTTERLRIARELHDIVAHRMSVISMHAGTARLSLENEPERAREAIETVERASRGALADLRQLLAVLRSDASDTDGRSPAPVLADLHSLVADVVSTGVTVDVSTTGDLAAVPAGIALATYRIVQEALTNVVKHAGRTRAVVAVDVTSDAVKIAVHDDGPGPDARRFNTDGRTGQGTIGMRERVALYGGELHVGPTPSGGWAVDARLPVDEAAT